MVGTKSNSGGYRLGSGPPIKYDPIIPDYKPDSPQNIIKALIDIHGWILARKIDNQTASSAIRVLEVLSKILMPYETLDRLNKLENKSNHLQKTFRTRN